MPAWFLATQIISWLLLMYLFVLWGYGFEKEFYEHGKIVAAFLAGETLVLMVV